MTVSFRAVGTWENGATGLTADEVLSVPAAQVSGDMMVAIGCWKDFAITAQISGWTESIEFTDGSVPTGNGTGSMKIGAWYKEATADPESNPTLDFSTTTGLVGEGVIIVFSKSLSFWETPTFVSAAWPSQSTGTVSASSTTTVPSGGVVIGIGAFRDDSTTMTRPTNAIRDSGGLVTWNGNHAEQPATHASTTTGNDMSCDMGYRLVTTGASGVTLQQQYTLSAAETGALMWVILNDTNTAPPSFQYPQLERRTRGIGRGIGTGMARPMDEKRIKPGELWIPPAARMRMAGRLSLPAGAR